MSDLSELSITYLDHCMNRKRLDNKTVRAYRDDIGQFCMEHGNRTATEITSDDIERYVAQLHRQFKPKTVKRKVASLKAFFNYLEYREITERNPFARLRLKFREPVILPRTIPLYYIESLLRIIYLQQTEAGTYYRRINAIRDAAVCELLFATGIRISELCALSIRDIDFNDNCILIYGKGAKERKLQIGNIQVIEALTQYITAYKDKIISCGSLFVNQSGNVFSDQAVRRMLNHYTVLASIELHITPHMFRHTFATSLLEADVDIRYIQEMLGHSSIHTTEIYTHVTMAKQRDILTTKHPRNNFTILS